VSRIKQEQTPRQWPIEKPIKKILHKKHKSVKTVLAMQVGGRIDKENAATKLGRRKKGE